MLPRPFSKQESDGVRHGGHVSKASPFAAAGKQSTKILAFPKSVLNKESHWSSIGC